MRYTSPTTVDEARSLLAEHPGSRVFAGATDLVPQMRSGRPAPPVLVDLKKIAQLMSVTHENGQWTIGAATPTANLTRNHDFTAMFPGLSEAMGLIGSDQIQNRSSLGGNLANASPAADSVPAMIANGVQAVIATADGTRTVPVAEIVTGPGRTSLADGEFIVEFTLADTPADTSDAYLRMIPRTEMDIAIVGSAVRLTVSDNIITDATVVLGAVAPTAVTVPDAGAALIGAAINAGQIDDSALNTLADAASAACDPIDDKRGTVAYRRRVAGVLTRRAAATAVERAQNGA
ncbi:MAG: xanthine dehydrogenase family protein subunit M [Actinobacteria bacterium]|nr:xanthine dehydrogenase family protein subunit M [Actinomycetota bacterium]